jgi:hypothetical protein
MADDNCPAQVVGTSIELDHAPTIDGPLYCSRVIVNCAAAIQQKERAR